MLLAGLVMLALSWFGRNFSIVVGISLVFIFEPGETGWWRPHFLEWLQHGDCAGDFVVTRRADLRIFLEMVNYWSGRMDISHPARNSARFRNAAAGLRRLHPICAGTFGAKNLLWAHGPKLRLLNLVGLLSLSVSAVVSFVACGAEILAAR